MDYFKFIDDHVVNPKWNVSQKEIEFTSSTF